MASSNTHPEVVRRALQAAAGSEGLLASRGLRGRETSAWGCGVGRVEEQAPSWEHLCWMFAGTAMSPVCSGEHATKRSLEDAVAASLGKVAGVDAAFLEKGEECRVYVVAREHDSVDRSALLDVEDDLSAEFGPVELAVRAHQGRAPSAMFQGLTRIL